MKGFAAMWEMAVISRISTSWVTLTVSVFLLYSCDSAADFEFRDGKGSAISIDSTMSKASVHGKQYSVRNCGNSSFKCITFERIAVASPRFCSDFIENETWNLNGLKFSNRIPSLHGGANDGIYISDNFPYSGFELRGGKIQAIFLTEKKKINEYINNNYSWRDLEPYKFYAAGATSLFKCQ